MMCDVFELVGFIFRVNCKFPELKFVDDVVLDLKSRHI